MIFIDTGLPQNELIFGKFLKGGWGEGVISDLKDFTEKIAIYFPKKRGGGSRTSLRFTPFKMFLWKLCYDILISSYLIW